MIKIITGFTYKSCVSFVMPPKIKFSITKFLCGAFPNQMSNYEDRQSFNKRKSSPSSPIMGKNAKKRGGSNPGNQQSSKSKGDGGRSPHGAGKGNNPTQARKQNDSESSQRSRTGPSKQDGHKNRQEDSSADSYSEGKEKELPIHLRFTAWDENDEKELKKIRSKDGDTKGKKHPKSNNERDGRQTNNALIPGAPQQHQKFSGSSVDSPEYNGRPSSSVDTERKASATRQMSIPDYTKSTGSNQHAGNRQTQSFGGKEPQNKHQQVQTRHYIPGLPASNSAQRSNEQSMAEQGISISELNRAPECFTKKLTQEEILQSLNNHVSFVGSIPSVQNECLQRHYSDYVNTPLSDTRKYQGGYSRWDCVAHILFNPQNKPIRYEGDLQYTIQQLRQLDSGRPENFVAFRRFFEELGSKNRDEYDKFFNHTLPAMTRLASELPIMHLNDLPFLKKWTNMSLTLSQKQVACLLSHAFFCTFPNRPGRKEKGHEVPDINFSSLYSVFEDADKPWKAQKEIKRKVEKLKCLVHYFMSVTDRYFKSGTDHKPDGNITYQRLYDDCKNVDWHCSKQELTKLYVDTDSTIEEVGGGMLQADFANKFVGGGVLNTGLVQEEIRFVLCPEMILSRLFTEALTDREVLLMIGCERFSDYSGYSDTFQFTGPHKDNTTRDALGRRFTEVVAMDALVFKSNKEAQFQPRHIARELNKAYVAFKAQPLNQVQPAVCTGNWGCGAFGGDKQLKALIQIMAASAAGRDVCYVTFKERELDKLSYIHRLLTTRNMAIRDIVGLLEAYYNTVYRNKEVEPLFDFLEEKVSSGKGDLPSPTNWNFSDDEQPNYKQSGGKHWDPQRKNDDKYRPEHPRNEDSRASHTNQNVWRNADHSHSAGHKVRKGSGDDGSDAADIISGSILSGNLEGVGNTSEVTKSDVPHKVDEKNGSCGTQGAKGRSEERKNPHGDSKIPGNTGDSHH